MKQIIKWVVGVSLIVALAIAVDWQQLLEHLRKVTFGTALLAFALLTVQFPISSWKWSWALRMHGLRHSQGFLFRILVIGFFFNHFLPTSIGGDAYRVYRTVPVDGFKSRAFSAIAIERLTGLAALFLLGALAAFPLAADYVLARTYLIAFALGSSASLVGFFAMRAGWLKPVTKHFRRFAVFEAVEHNLNRILGAWKEWLPLIGLSFLFQSIAILIVFVLFAGLGEPVSPVKCALIASAAAIATVLPISINGLGIVEATYAGTAVALGVSYEPALLVPILIRLLLLPHGLASGLIFLADRADVPASAGTAPPGRPSGSGSI